MEIAAGAWVVAAWAEMAALRACGSALTLQGLVAPEGVASDYRENLLRARRGAISIIAGPIFLLMAPSIPEIFQQIQHISTNSAAHAHGANVDTLQKGLHESSKDLAASVKKLESDTDSAIAALNTAFQKSYAASARQQRVEALDELERDSDSENVGLLMIALAEEPDADLQDRILKIMKDKTGLDLPATGWATMSQEDRKKVLGRVEEFAKKAGKK
ncbi:hypothetical protein BH09SUM1_BH09SUM1_25330 [soil metagenome]